METVVWLWLYDRRWFFGVKAPNLVTIWTLPLINNAFFVISLFYYSSDHSDACYNGFRNWIAIRLLMLVLIIVSIASVYRQTKYTKKKDHVEMEAHKVVNPILLKNYNYWITRKVLISFPGLSLLFLGLLNWYWIGHGMNMVYTNYREGTLTGCEDFMHSIVWGNLIMTMVFSLPVFIVFSGMILIKGSCILLGVVSPSTLIYFKKHGLAGLWRKRTRV